MDLELSEIMAICSAVTAVVSLYIAYKAHTKDEVSLQFELHKQLTDAEREMDLAEKKMILETETLKYEKAIEDYEASVEKICNIYELASIMFLKRRLDRAVFIDLYGPTYINLFDKNKSNGYTCVLYPDDGETVFTNILKVRRRIMMNDWR